MPSEPVALPIPGPAPAKPVLQSQPDAWAYLGLPRSTWFRLRSAGKLPEPVNVPTGGLYWRTADLDKWAAGLKPNRRRRRSGKPSARSTDASAIDQ